MKKNLEIPEINPANKESRQAIKCDKRLLSYMQLLLLQAKSRAKAFRATGPTINKLFLCHP